MPRSWRSQITDEVRACSQMKPRPMLEVGDRVQLSDQFLATLDKRAKHDASSVGTVLRFRDGRPVVKRDRFVMEQAFHPDYLKPCNS